jgi:hypothetical protein
MASAYITAPRAVRVLELDESGTCVYKGLHVVEIGVRLIFLMKPNHKTDLVSTTHRVCFGEGGQSYVMYNRPSCLTLILALLLLLVNTNIRDRKHHCHLTIHCRALW